MTRTPDYLLGTIVHALGGEVDYQNVTSRRMFGGITLYTHGRNFASLSNRGLALKLDQPDRESLLRIAGARPLQYDPEGPVIQSMVLLPDAMLDDHPTLRRWLMCGILWCQTLSPPRPRKARK